MNSLSGLINLDFRSSEPLYLQIVRQIKNLVTQGDLKQGDQLPTVRELAVELRINFNTVARAYRVLDDSGLISTQRGRGTYIWESSHTTLTPDDFESELKKITKKYISEAQMLGATNENILDLIRILLVDGTN